MNGILLIDKPMDWTSMDVCAKLRGALREKKIGHSGTLDPMATGLLVVFLGRATRAVEFAEADRKTYIAGLRLGLSTDTQDVTGTAIRENEVNVTLEQMEEAFAKYRGDIEQIPPMYSAIKINGQKLYDIARKGREVERKARPITIYSLEKVGENDGDALLEVTCSKGTYIRTLCNDIGDYLGCGGCMSSLRRTRAGTFSLEQAHTLEEVLALAANGEAEKLLLPVDTLFADVPKVILTKGQEKVIRNGGNFTCNLEQKRYRLYSDSGEFLALGEIVEGRMKSVKSFYEV